MGVFPHHDCCMLQVSFRHITSPNGYSKVKAYANSGKTKTKNPPVPAEIAAYPSLSSKLWQRRSAIEDPFEVIRAAPHRLSQNFFHLDKFARFAAPRVSELTQSN